MNVKQLIKKLSEFPEQLEVKIECEDGNLYGIQKVHQENDGEPAIIVPFENEEETSNSEDDDNK